jgi:hypothetical protein
MWDIDEKLEALQPGDIMYIGCPTPYCSGDGGKCAVCHDTWSDCGCGYNWLNCACGCRADEWRLLPWLAWQVRRPWRWLRMRAEDLLVRLTMPEVR